MAFGAACIAFSLHFLFDLGWYAILIAIVIGLFLSVVEPQSWETRAILRFRYPDSRSTDNTPDRGDAGP